MENINRNLKMKVNEIKKKVSFCVEKYFVNYL